MSRVLAVVYVGVVAALTAWAFRSPDNGFGAAEAAAGLLALPLVVPALPLIYVVGALAWQLSDADGAGPMLPVTITFTAMMALVAVANVALVRLAVRALSRSRARGTGHGPHRAQP